MATSKLEREFISLMDAHVTFEVSDSSLSDAISFIGDNYSPEDVFSIKDLENWAESNGYVKE